jgi:PAS domain S-box-containing protein
MPNHTTVATSFLSGGGTTGQRMRNADWKFNLLGSPAQWPQSLKTALRILLNSSLPTVLFWNAEYTCFYNDAFLSGIAGVEKTQFPTDRPGHELWAESWPHIKALLDRALAEENIVGQHLPLPVFQNGHHVQPRWAFNGHALHDDTGTPVGVFITCTETARQAAQNTHEMLHDSEKKFRDLVSEAPVGITVFHGTRFTVEMANEAYLSIVDKSEKELVGKPFFETLPELKDALQPLLAGVLHSGRPCHGYEFPVSINRHGKIELAYFNFVYQPIHEGTTIDRIMVVANEVTESVKAKHLLSESERQFRNLVMQSPIPMTIFRGRDYVIEMANPNMFDKIWKKKESEVIGRKALDIFPELKDQKFPELLEKVFRTGKPHRENEAEAYIGGGHEKLRKFYLDFEYSPLFDTDGSVSGIMITVNDVTEKVEARQRIEEIVTELKVFKFMADNVTDFIGISDREGVPLYINQSGMKKIGLESVEQVRQTHLRDYFFPEDVEHLFEDFIPRVVEEGSGEIEIRFRNFKTGEPIWMLYNVVSLRSINEDPYGFATVSKDITEQKDWVSELERRVRERTSALEESNRQLERSNEDLQQFAHVASHDLKEPIRKIKTFSHKLHDDFKDLLGERGNVYLHKIISSTTRMYSMIDGVLNYASITATQQHMVQVDLSNIIDNIKADLEVLIQEKKATLEYHNLPAIEGMPALMHQLFYNLINNSLKFSQTGKDTLIVIENQFVIHEGMKYARLTLRDNGIGFDNAYAESIFTTFTRLNSKDRYEGTGLGLALCKKIVLRHNGHISARGETDKGAEFTILLPLIHKNH